MPVLSRIPRLVLCLFLLGSRVGDLCAQPYSYIQYTTADGLPTNYVYGVVEDEEGYIWAYTENGLAKFDGYEFTTLSVSDGLPGPDVTYAERGPDGKIWLQTYRNRPAYLYRDSVHVIGHQTCVINQISEGVVCYGCGDKYLIIREGAQLVYLATGEVSTALVAAYPRFFRFQYALENQGQQPEFSRLELVYARSGDSLRFYQPTGVLTRIPLPSGGEIYRYNDEWLIWRDTAGQWQEVLLTQGGSSLRLGRLLTIGERTIYLLTRGAGQILLIDLEQASGKEINLYELGLSPRYAAVITVGKEAFWISTDDGALQVDGAGTVVDQLRIPALCERYFLQRTYRDAAGNYWIGSRDGGLFLVPAPWQRVRHIPTPASEELSFERLVAMPGGRLLGITANTGIYEIREDAMLEILPPDRLQYFRSALWEPAGLLVASSQQLSRIRLVDDLWQVSPVHFQGVEGADPELSRTLGAFFADREEEILWNLLDLGQDAITGEVLALRGGGDFLLHLRLEGGGARLQSLQVARDIAVMLVHPDQQQWYYGSPAGLWEGAEPNPRPFLRAYPELRNITSLYGSPDRLWIGVEGAGLFVYTFSEDQLRRVDGVGQVDVIRPAAKNELLAAGREGMYVVAVDQGRVLEHYTVHDGLSTSLVNDVYAKGDSLIYIASPKGVQIIDRRRSYSSGLSAGALSLRGIRVNDTLAPADQLGRLGHRRNSLTFRYHLRSYASNGAITYFTRLEPLEEEWQSSGEREVRYAALAPGRYAFHLRARDAFGHEVSLAPIPIHIYPPFWRTGWFLGAAAMAFVGLVWGVYRWRLRREKDRLRTEQALEKRLAGLELDALKAQMNPHFVFNALGAIQYFIQTREVEAADHYLTKFARLMRQYLESSREKMIPLDQEVDLLRQYSELEQMRFEELFAVDISVAPELHRQDHYLPAMLIQPFVENAINHGLCERRDGQGRLAVTFNWDGERIRCTIADNGIGRERAGQLRHRGHRSRGMAIVRDKIETLRTSGLADIDVTVQDLDPAATDFPGTLVSLLIKNLDDETP